MASSKQDSKKVSNLLQTLEKDKKVSTVADGYLEYFDRDNEGVKDKRKNNAKQMTTQYYDLATDFYEYGWGESFHFACLNKKESMEHALKRHEYKLAMKLGIRKGEKVLVSTRQ